VGDDDKDLPVSKVGEIVVLATSCQLLELRRPRSARSQGEWFFTGDAGYLDAKAISTSTIA